MADSATVAGHPERDQYRRRPRAVLTSYVEWTRRPPRAQPAPDGHRADREHRAIWHGTATPSSPADRLPHHHRAPEGAHHEPTQLLRRNEPRRRRGLRRARRSPAPPASGRSCSVLQCAVEIDPGQTREVVILLGAAPDAAAARAALVEYRDLARAGAALTRRRRLGERLSAVTVRAPEPTSTRCSTAALTRRSPAGSGPGRRCNTAGAYGFQISSRT
jgi:hypothetical protein